VNLPGEVFFTVVESWWSGKKISGQELVKDHSQGENIAGLVTTHVPG
jgi:hypothetical protein